MTITEINIVKLAPLLVQSVVGSVTRLEVGCE